MRTFSVARPVAAVALLLFANPVTIVRERETTVVASQRSDQAVGVLSFTDITAAAGMSSAATGSHGAFWADATGDGRPDLFLTYNECRSGERANKFYRNLGGTFIEEAAARGLVRLTGGTHGGAFADLDNDGDYDLVTGETYETDCVDTEEPPPLPNRIFRNVGGQFVESTPASMAAYADYTRSILAFDMDRDGDLDIFGVNGDRGSGEPIPDRNELYRNDGGFNFAAITSGALVTTPAGQAGTDTDYDGDGDMDILMPNFGRFIPGDGDVGVMRNEGNGTFVKVPRTSIGIVHAATTGITTGDINNDGRTDLILVDQDRDPLRRLGYDRIAYVYLNTGGGSFNFVSEVRGIPGYTAGLADLDNDSDLDLVFPGFPNVLLNNGNGAFSAGPTYATPTPAPGCSGIACTRPDPRTLGFADIDNDGDLDFVVTTKFGVFHMFRNNFDAGNWLKVQLTAANGQAGAFGAKVRIYRAGTSSLVAFREAKNVYGYLSQDDPIMHIGLGSATTVDVEVTYLNGSRVTRQGVSANQRIAFFGTSVAQAPGAPTNLAAAVAGNSVSLSWSAGSGAPPTGYIVEAGSASGLSNLAIINTPGQSLNASAPPGTYYVRVKAVNSAGSSPASNEITVVVGGGGGCTVAPGPPGPLTFTVAGSLVTLNWRAPATGGTPTTYLIEVGSVAGAADLVVIDLGGSGVTLSANAPPGVYYVRVKGRNPCGTGAVSNEVVIQVQ